MWDWLSALGDTTGYVPRKECGGWTAEWVAVHTLSDVLIWLAYLSIPLVLLSALRHPAVRPFRAPARLFAVFILACGSVHLIEAVLFEHPIYRLSGVMKAITAAVSWATVFVLIPTVPRLLERLVAPPAEPADEAADADQPWPLVYALAILVGLLAVLLRYVLDPMLGDLHPYTLCVLAVAFVSWYGGFLPGVVTLLLSGAASTYLFVPVRGELVPLAFNHQVGVGLLLMAGVAVAVVGEGQRTVRRRLHRKILELHATAAALAAEKATADRTVAALAVEKAATDRALAQLDALVRNAPYAIAFYDDELRFVRVNDALVAGTGLPADAFIGRHLLEARPDAPPEAVAAFRAVLAGGPPLTAAPVAARGGMFEVSAFRVPVDADRTGLAVIAQDVTEKYQAAEQLRESAEQFRAMADGIPQLAWMARPDGHIFWYNRRWHEYTGTALAEMEGWGWQSVHDPVELKRVMVTWPAALAAGRPFEDTFPLRRHDGEMRWHLTRATPLRDDAGNVLLWFGTNTDITGQRQMEEQLRESEGRFRQMAETMPQFVWKADPTGYHYYFNRRWYEYTGRTADESAGAGWADALHPDDRPAVGRKWAAALAGGTVYETELRLRRADGQYHSFLVRAYPVRDADGTVIRWLGTSTDIDEQVRTKRLLADATRFAETVLDSLSSHIAVLADDGTILAVNRSWRRFGADNGVAEDYPWEGTNYVTACRDDADGERATDGIRAVADGTVPAFEMEYPDHGADGERYFHLRVRRFADDDPVRLVVSHENVTARVVAERRIRQAESQLRQLTEGMPLLMWACRPTGECDYLSRQWVEYTGVPAAEQMPYGWLDALHPDDRGPTAAAWRQATEHTGEYDIEFRLRRHDGGHRWFAVRGIPLRDRGGAIVHWYGSCTDIDDRKRRADTLEREVAERTVELRRQQVFVSAILDSIAEGVVACDADGQLRLFNAATRDMHGLPAEPLPPDAWAAHYQLFEADGVTPMPADRVPLTRAWRGEPVRDAELVIRRPGHADRYVLCTGQPLRAADGGQFGAVVSMRDMTARRDFERQLQLTADALRASNEELDKFAYVASHDLQEPLRKIQAFGTRLADKSGAALDEPGRDYLDRMLASAGRMRRLITDLLAFARVNAHPSGFGRVDLNAVLDDVRADLEVRLAETGGTVDVPAPLPPVRGDASLLRQVFQNLTANALKFARDGVPPVVRVTAEAGPAGGVRVVVADNGLGFRPEFGEKIFELFQRLHPKTRYEGSGLGLAIVRKILARHGATIAAHGRPGDGATFVIDWPLAAPPS